MNHLAVHAELTQFLFRLLYYRYYNYELDQPFLPQYQENQRQLILALREEV